MKISHFKKNGIQRAVSRKRGCMPADSFVGIWKFVARPNLCETPACVKPPPRYLSFWDSEVRFESEKKIEKRNRKLIRKKL